MKKETLILKKITNSLKTKLGKELVSIILFGSHAKNKVKEYSDIDILAVARNSPNDWREKDKLAVGIGDEVDYPLDLILLTPKEFHRATLNLSPLILSIFEGDYNILYGKDLIRKERRDLYSKYQLKKISKFGWKFKKVAA